MLPVAAALGSCIDEDLSKCGYDYTISYEVHTRTNLSSTLAAQLEQSEETAIKDKLAEALSPVFNDQVTDLQLSFFDPAQATLAHYEDHIINARQSAFTIYLPVAEYRHHALANQQTETLVTQEQHDSHLTHRLVSERPDTIAPHTLGVFSGRLSMVTEEREQGFHVDLYMINCATALVIDLAGLQPDDIQVYASGFADRFMVNDSLYATDATHIVRTRRVVDGAGREAYYAAHFPSELMINGRASGAWQMEGVIKMPGEGYVRTVLTVDTPMEADEVRVIKARLKDDGTLVTDAADVGVSVSLDWKPGGNYDIEM